MIQLKLNNIVILGVDAENIKRLQEGQPMLIDMTKFGEFNKLAVFYGEKTQDIKNDIEKMTGLKLPDMPDKLKSGETQDLTDLAKSMNEIKH